MCFYSFCVPSLLHLGTNRENRNCSLVNLSFKSLGSSHLFPLSRFNKCVNVGKGFHNRISSGRLRCIRINCSHVENGSSEKDMSKRYFGFVALLGKTNSGKSTLLNALVEAKVAIVTPKVQTTRTKIIGVFTEGSAQLAFMDTPGIFTPRKRLERAMMDAAQKSRFEADLIVFVIDLEQCLSHENAVDDTSQEIANLLRKKRKQGSELFLCLNKIDRLSTKSIVNAEEEILKALNLPFRQVFKVSALTGRHVKEMRDSLIQYLPQGPWMFDEDDMTNLSMRSIAAEVTREKLMLKLRLELPYCIAVSTVEWRDLDNGSIRILQHVYVERESQKAIVLGHGGQKLKEIGMEARQELCKIFEKPVHLFLQVKVKKDWDEDREFYKDWGLRYNV